MERIFPEAEPETKIWAQIVSLEGDIRKTERFKMNEMAQEKSRECHVQDEGLDRCLLPPIVHWIRFTSETIISPYFWAILANLLSKFLLETALGRKSVLLPYN